MKSKDILFVLSVLLLAGCGGSGSSKTAGQGPLNGNWQFTLALTPQSTKTKSESGFIQQSGSGVAGEIQMNPGDGACPGVGSAIGSLSGENVSLTIDIVGQAETLTGTLDSAGATMSGNYTLLTSGCGESESGVWTAVTVLPFSGNFTANLSAKNGTQWTATGSITQGSSGGGVTAPVSGPMTSSDPKTTPSCFSSASFTGVVSGTSLIWNLADSSGVQLGQFSLTFDPSSNDATGTYRIDSQVGVLPPGAPCRPGETGTISVTFP